MTSPYFPSVDPTTLTVRDQHLPARLQSAALTESAQDAAAGLFTSGTHSGVSFVYDDALAKLNATVSTGSADLVTAQAARLGLIAFDTFTRADASTIGLTLESGQSWEQQAGAPAVASGRLTASAAFVAAADVGRADQDVRCKITVAAGTASSLCFRVGPTSADRLQIALDTTNGFRLSKLDTNVLTALETAAFTFTAGQTYEVRAVVAGAVISCYLDGNQLIPSHTLDTGEQTKYGAYTRVGLRQTGTTATFFDDFAVRVPYPAASGTGLPTGSYSVYIATGDDSNLAAALASVTASATVVAVAVAGS